MADEIVLTKLGNLAAVSLKHELTEESVAFEEMRADHGGHGELATAIIVIGASAVAVVALASWLLKSRSSETVEVLVQRKYADGSEETIHFKHKVRDEEEAKPELVEALTETFKIGVDVDRAPNV